MDEHLTEQEVTLFRSRTLEPTERKRIDSHVIKCESCMRRILPAEDAALAYSELTEAFLTDSSEEAFHLSKKELGRYAGATADTADRISFESHLENCLQCNAALQSYVGSNLPAKRARSFRRLRDSDSTEKKNVFAIGHAAQFITPARAIATALVAACLVLVVFIWQRRHAEIENRTIQSSASQTPPIPQPSGVRPGAGGEATESSGNDHSEIIASLKDNGRAITLSRTGTLGGLEDLPEASRSLVRGALTTGNVPKPEVLDQLTSPSVTLMGLPERDDSFALIGPLGMVIVSDHPRLRWNPLKGATSYTVSVFDSDFNRVASSASQTGTQWATRKLPRGTIYSWEVVALRDGQEMRSPPAAAPRARFKVLEAERLTELLRQKQAQPISHLSLGLMYARFGLLTEAEQQLHIVARENPESPVAKRLLQTVRNWRHR